MRLLQCRLWTHFIFTNWIFVRTTNSKNTENNTIQVSVANIFIMWNLFDCRSRIIYIDFNTKSNGILWFDMPFCICYVRISIFLVSIIPVFLGLVFFKFVSKLFFVSFFVYQFFSIVIDYAGGEANLLKITAGVRAVNLQTPPLCCCLKFLKSLPLTK